MTNTGLSVVDSYLNFGYYRLAKLRRFGYSYPVQNLRNNVVPFNSMPLFLKLFTGMGLMAGFGILVLLGIPIGGGYSINGEIVSREAFWRKCGLEVSVIMIWFFAYGIGFLRRESWSRYIFLLLPVYYGFYEAIEFFILHKFSAEIFLNASVTILLWYWYFFAKRSVREYFGA